MATKSRKAPAKSARKRGATRKRGMKASSRGTAKARVATLRRRVQSAVKSPVARVKRVTREVVHQAAVAVTAGVETLKDLGENLVDRVRA